MTRPYQDAQHLFQRHGMTMAQHGPLNLGWIPSRVAMPVQQCEVSVALLRRHCLDEVAAELNPTCYYRLLSFRSPERFTTGGQQ